MASTSMILDMDSAEPMTAAELRKFLESVPDSAIIINNGKMTRSVVFKSDTWTAGYEGTVEIF